MTRATEPSLARSVLLCPQEGTRGGVEAALCAAALALSPLDLLHRFQDLERRQEQQKKIQAEIKRVNDENQRLKEEQREQERMADERVLEYQRQKMVRGLSMCGTGIGSADSRGAAGAAMMLCPTQEREAEFEAEQERIRREKEKEMARLRAMQERAQDHQAEQVSGVLTHNVLLCWLAHHLPRHRPSKAKAPLDVVGLLGRCRSAPAPGPR